MSAIAQDEVSAGCQSLVWRMVHAALRESCRGSDGHIEEQQWESLRARLRPHHVQQFHEFLIEALQSDGQVLVAKVISCAPPAQDNGASFQNTIVPMHYSPDWRAQEIAARVEGLLAPLKEVV